LGATSASPSRRRHRPYIPCSKPQHCAVMRPGGPRCLGAAVPHRTSEGNTVVFFLLLCVPAVVPWRENGPSPTDRLNMWLLASCRRGDAVACVPTIESSLTPAGAAAIDRGRTPLDHLRLSHLSCTHRDKFWVPAVPGRDESTCRSCARQARCCLGPCIGRHAHAFS
jgi:hypothetical protein